MTWVKIDDHLPTHPKVIGLSDKAFRLYVSSICFSSANLTDGEIPAAALQSLGGTAKLAKELEEAALWDTTSRKGWAVHDYLAYNRSKIRALETSDVRSKAGSKGAANRWQNATQNAWQNDGKQFLSASLSEESPSDSLGEPEREDRQKPSKLLSPPKKTAPTEEWANAMREKYKLRDFDESLKFYMNQGYYRTCSDKCAYLEGKLKAAAIREGAPVAVAVGQNVNEIHQRNLDLERVAWERKNPGVPYER